MNLLDATLSEDLSLRNERFKKRFESFMTQRYFESILSVITYRMSENVMINPIELEYFLRYYGGCAIGLCNDGIYRILGYASYSDIGNFSQFNTNHTVVFTLPKKLRLPKYTLSNFNTKGNFIIVENHSINLNTYTDFSIIQHYIEKLSEIELSRFSIVQQAKFNTLLRSEAGDEDIKQIAKSMYNANPYIEVTKFFDPEEAILEMGNYKLTPALKDLKNEYNTTINELNSYFGINSAGIVKESGVSDSELNSNDDFLTINAFNYIDSRNTKLNLFSKYNPDFNMKAILNARSEKAINPIDVFKNESEVDIK